MHRCGPFRIFFEAQRCGCFHRNPKGFGKHFDRRRGELHASAAWAIGLSEHESNVVTVFSKRTQCFSGKVRRTGKNDLHEESLKGSFILNRPLF